MKLFVIIFGNHQSCVEVFQAKQCLHECHLSLLFYFINVEQFRSLYITLYQAVLFVTYVFTLYTDVVDYTLFP